LEEPVEVIEEDSLPSSTRVLTTPVLNSINIFDETFERQDKIIHTTVQYHLARTKVETGALSTVIAPSYVGAINCGSTGAYGSDGDGGDGGCGGCGGG
jgi:hypothetical protein